jgi:hypothetical protein
MKKSKEKDIYKGLLNESSLEFDDISSEIEREYIFPNGNKLLIKHPIYLNVSKSGGHRIYTLDGYSYYVQPKEGWSIKWETKESKSHFVK